MKINPELLLLFFFAGSLACNLYIQIQHALTDASILWPNSEILEIYYEMFRSELCYYLQHNLVWFAVLAVSCFSIAEVY